MKALVIGAGMGGLCAALALQQQGIEVEVNEQAGALREVGAGLTLTRGALRSLHAIGVLDAVRAVSRLCPQMPFVHYQTARLLWGAFPGPEAAAADGVANDDDPFIARHVFRADLQRVLAEAFQTRAPGALRLGHALARFEQDADSVTASFTNGERSRGDVLIGADGLNSVVRAALWGAAAPVYTGQVAWRFLLDGALARPHLSTGRATVFVGPDCTFNRYTLRGGEVLNCVAIVRTPGWQGEGWAIPGDPAELAALFEGWHPDVRALMALATPAGLNKWALGVRPALPTWREGRIAVLGDAAHPMLPFLGLGAAMAIEDAALLGRAFAAEPDPQCALARYEAARRPRATQAQEASVQQGLALQARDPDRFDGDAAPVGSARGLFDYDPMAVVV